MSSVFFIFIFFFLEITWKKNSFYGQNKEHFSINIPQDNKNMLPVSLGPVLHMVELQTQNSCTQHSTTEHTPGMVHIPITSGLISYNSTFILPQAGHQLLSDRLSLEGQLILPPKFLPVPRSLVSLPCYVLKSLCIWERLLRWWWQAVFAVKGTNTPHPRFPTRLSSLCIPVTQ